MPEQVTRAGNGNGNLQLAINQLREHLPQVFGAVSKQINLAQLSVKSGAVGHVTIGQVTVGDVVVGSMKLVNTSATLQSSQALLENVGINLELQFRLIWSYDLGIFGGGSGTENLGSMFFAMSVGNVFVPSLGAIQMNVPQVTVDNVAARVPPMSDLDLGSASFSQLNVTGTRLPTPGFALNGMSFGTFRLSDFEVPAATSDEVRIDQFRPDQDVVLPGASVGPVSIPSTSVPSVRSGSFNFDARTDRRSIGANFGLFGISIEVTPIAHMRVGAMTLAGLQLSATVGNIAVENVRIPVDVHGILLRNLTLASVTANDVTI